MCGGDMKLVWNFGNVGVISYRICGGRWDNHSNEYTLIYVNIHVWKYVLDTGFSFKRGWHFDTQTYPEPTEQHD